MILPIILAGGSGTRLWPLSRSMFPKQFLSLASEMTMIQETVSRIDSISYEKPITICNEEHRFIVAEQLRTLNKLGPVLLEPEGRNTAPAIALAALYSNQLYQNNDPVLLVCSADHNIKDQEKFKKAVKDALPLANEGKLVTFGVVPSKPHIGYGYIHRDKPIGNAFSVNQFVEKPDFDTAEHYCESGEYYWNSGIFMFKASRYLSELNKHRPDIYSSCQKAWQDTNTELDFMRVNEDAFKACPSESIDYAVMEKSENVIVQPLDANWSDVGSWSSLWDICDKDKHGNVLQADSIIESTKNSYIYSKEKLVTAVGVENLIVVDTKDSLMVAHKDQVEDVKKIVENLKSKDRSEWQQHREVYRPWGKYDSIDCGTRYQVKRITVNPGAKLSVQMHFHRAEHWVVVSGTAKVTNGEKTYLVGENESTFIPLGVVHALENPGKVPLELIEVQSGSYLGEDDIIRFEDKYGRTESQNQAQSLEVE